MLFTKLLQASEVNKNQILTNFGLSSSRAHDKYFGHPTVVGRNKRKVFGEIKDKVWKLINGWRKGVFSVGGKEILIKAVLQVVPSYLISIFQLPISLRNKLKSLILNFWWGGGQGERKIAWRSWEQVCLP